MNDWHTTCLGLKRLPRELSGFEIEAFFHFSAAERRVIEERRKPGLMLAFRCRERLFIPAERWQQTRRAQYRRLALPTEAGAFLEPLLEQSQHAIARVADAAVKGELRVDDELHPGDAPRNGPGRAA